LSENREILLVVVGEARGSYALARAFHEAYRCKTIAVVKDVVHPIQHSRLVTPVVVPGLFDDAEVMVGALEAVAAENPGRTLVLLSNDDRGVQVFVDHAERLSERFAVSVCTADALEPCADKIRFAEVCERLGIATPTTVQVDLTQLRASGGRAALDDLVVDLDFPVVAKPASSAQYERSETPSVEKASYLVDRAALDDLLVRLLDTGYEGIFLVQETIAGDDTWKRTLTAYRDTSGTITMMVTGQILLEGYQGATGYGVLTTWDDEAVEAVTRFLDDVGYVGFAQADYKVDPRTGRHVFFEINPRIGSGNYYATAAGANPARAVVTDLVEHRSTGTVRGADGVLYLLVPFRLLLRYIADPALKDRLRQVRRSGRLANLWRYRLDSGWRRRYVVEGMIWSAWYKLPRQRSQIGANGL